MAIGLGFGILCCGGVGGVIGLANLGMDMIVADIEDQLRDHPQLRAEVGEIQSLELNWSKTLNAEDEDVNVMDLQGSTGSGELTVSSTTNDQNQEDIAWATLRTSDGRTINLDL